MEGQPTLTLNKHLEGLGGRLSGYSQCPECEDRGLDPQNSHTYWVGVVERLEIVASETEDPQARWQEG